MAEKAKSEGRPTKATEEVCFRPGNKEPFVRHNCNSNITTVANGSQGVGDDVIVSFSTANAAQLSGSLGMREDLVADQPSGSQGMREDLIAGQSSGSQGMREDLGGSNEQSCTVETMVEAEQNALQVPASPWSEYMDERGDEIIGQLDISDIEEKMKEDKEGFRRYVDRKLKNNISQLKFLGKIIGLAICEGFFINLNICKPIVKQVCWMLLYL